jgi:hypothetical protein
MNRAGGPEFAIDIRVSAFQAFLTKIKIVFHADITGFSVRMIDTFAHFKPPVSLLIQVL